MRGQLVLLAALLAAPAFAQEDRSSPLPNHLPVRVEACFGRTYDAAHLREHPRQRVTSFHILRDFEPDRHAETEPRSRSDMIDIDGNNGDITLNAYLRLHDRKGVYSNYFNCRRTEKGVVQCGIDCDGGTFLVRPSGSSLLIENLRILQSVPSRQSARLAPSVEDPGLRVEDRVVGWRRRSEGWVCPACAETSG